MFRLPWEKPAPPQKAAEEVSKLEEFKDHLMAIQAYIESQIDNKLIYSGKAIPKHLASLSSPRLVAFMLSNPDICVHGMEAHERKCSELLLLNNDVKKLTARIEKELLLVRGEAVFVAKERVALNTCRNIGRSVIFLTEDMQRAVDALKILRDLYKESKEDHGRGARKRKGERTDEEVECYELAITYLTEARNLIVNVLEQLDIAISLEQQLMRAQLKGATPS